MSEPDEEQVPVSAELMEQFMETLGTFQESLTQISARLEQAEVALAESRENIDWLTAKLKERQSRCVPVPYSWRFTHSDDREAMWAVLRSFVDWLNSRYFAESWNEYIPECWHRHPRAVEELTAVWAAWHAAYHDHSSPSDQAAYWHDRVLWPTMERLEGTFRSCREEKGHQEYRTPVHVTGADFEEFIADPAGEPSLLQDPVRVEQLKAENALVRKDKETVES